MTNLGEEKTLRAMEALIERETQASGAPPPTPPSSTLEDLLKKLLEKLKALEDDFAQKSKDLKQCRDDKKEIEDALAEIKKFLDAYTKAQDGIRQQKEEKLAYQRLKKPMIDATPQALKDSVWKSVNEVDDRIKEIAQEMVRLEKAATTAKQDFDGAKADHEKKKQAYLEVTLQQKKIEDGFKTLTQLKDNIEKEEVNTELGLMYYFMDRYNKLLDKTLPELWSVDTLKNELQRTWVLFDEAREKQRTSEEQWQKAQAAFLEKQAQWTKARDEREKEILELLRKL